MAVEVNLEEQAQRLFDSIPAVPDVADPAGEGQDPETVEQQTEEPDQQTGEAQTEQAADGEQDDATALATLLKTKLNLPDTFELDLSLEGIEKAIQTGIDALSSANPLSNNPELQEVAEWLEKGGTIETYKAIPQALDFTSTAIGTEDVDLQQQFALAYLINLKGEAQEDAQDQIDYLKDKGKLHSFALTAQAKLQEDNDNRVNAYKEQHDKQVAADKAAAQAQWDEVSGILTKGFTKFNVPAAELKALKEYVLPDAKGVSKSIEARKNLTAEEMLLIDYLILNKFKGVAAEPVKAAQTKTINVKSIVGKTTGKADVSNPTDTLATLAQMNKTYFGGK